MQRIAILYQNKDIGLPHVFVKDEPLRTVDVLGLHGISKTKARQMIESGTVKVEALVKGEVKKITLGETLDDLYFSVVENGRVACALLWLGKKNPLLVIA